MPRWFKITLWSVLIVCTVGFAGVQYIFWSISNTPWTFSTDESDHWDARADFMAQFGGVQCLTSDAIRAEAEAHEFVFWTLEQDLRWCHRPVGLSDWVGVEIMPPQSFSTLDENSEYFGFDANGCYIPWEDASGAGTTCPTTRP